MKAIIQTSTALTPNVKRFLIETEVPINALPGQFVTLSFPELLDENNRSIARSYSLLNWAANGSQLPVIELCISLNSLGKVTPWLWGLDKPVEIESTEALGTFTLRDYQDSVYDEVSRILFICTGTGIAPFIPMIEHILNNHPQKEVFLYSGNRNFTDELFTDILKLWEVEFPLFTYVPVFSREVSAENYGYVHAFYKEALHMNCHVYVCGWSEMCKEARQHLKAMGLTRKQYFFEQYN